MKSDTVADFVMVGRAEDHPHGEVRSYEVGGRGIAVASTDAGWFAVDDECTHRHCSLGQGDLVGTSLVCPCHLGTYDVQTGEVIEGPPPEPVRTYPVLVADGEIRISV